MDKNSMLRLSPNEVEFMIKTETNKLRIFRIQQVREQAREQAINIRSAVKEEEKRQKELIKHKLEKQWLGSHKKKLSNLKDQYNDVMAVIGQAHEKAANQIETEALMKAKISNRDALAKQRGREAMKAIENKKNLNEKEYVHNRRQEVLKSEKIRAQKIAAKPLPKKFINEKSKPPVVKKVMFKEAGTFTTSSYVPKSIMVTKETAESHKNAKQAACDHRKRLAQIKENSRASEAEKQKMIVHRANAALKREQVKHMYAGAMKELADVDESDILQQIDDVQGDERGNKYCTNDDFRQADMEKKVEKLLDEMEAHDKKVQHVDAEKENLQQTKYDARILCNLHVNRATDKVSHRNLVNEYEHSNGSIHLKETVPLRTLTQTSDKYVIRVGSVGSPALLPKEVGHTKYNDSLPSIVTNSSRNSDLSPDANALHEPASSSNFNSEISSPGDETSLEKRLNLQKCCLHPTKIKTYKDPSAANFEPSTADKECQQMRTRLHTLMEKIQAQHSQDSSESPEYKNSSPCNQIDLLSNMEQIHANRNKVKGMLDAVKQQHSKQPVRKQTGVYVTPTKMYIEDIKDEGSNQKLISKRARFEQQKQLVVKHYLHRLLEMKRRGINVPLSSSESTPITFETLSSFSDSNASSERTNLESKSASKSAINTLSTNSNSTNKSSITSCSEQFLTESPSTMQVPSMSQESSGVTSTDSHLSTSSSTPEYSSESSLDAASAAKNLHYRYIDIDEIPVRDSNSPESNSWQSVRSERFTSQPMEDATSQNPAVQQRINEIYSRLDELKRLRQQLIMQEESNENKPVLISTNQTDGSGFQSSRLNSPGMNNEQRYIGTTMPLEQSQFTFSTPDSVHTSKDIADTEENHREDGHKLWEEAGYSQDSLISSLKNFSDHSSSPIMSDGTKSNCGKSTDSSSIPDVSEFLRKLGFNSDKIMTILDKDSCMSSN